MKNNFPKFALSVALVLAMSLTLSCSSDGSSSPKKTVKKEKISGVSQKGPFVKGGTVTLYELNDSYERTGIVFNGAVKSNNGIYEIEVNDYLASPYVEVEATGRYLNEITNAVSADNVTLKAIADVTDKDNVNINVITHLEHGKVLYYVKQGLSFADAKNKAFAEVLAELGIASPILKNSENMTLQADSVLLLASVLLQVGRTESALKTLLSTLVGIEAVKDGMAAALANYATAKNNIISSTPISPSSSSGLSSSSSLEGSSSSIIITKIKFIDDRDSTEYEYVKIGNQIWMAENLKYEAIGSKCYGQDGKIRTVDLEYDTLTDEQIQANCKKYGRLYDWATAMWLDYDESGAYTDSKKNKGVCPKGWLIPSGDDWRTLIRSVGPSCSTNGYFSCPEAVNALNAKDGWLYGYDNNDRYGFSALPGGYGDDGVFYESGRNGYWWTSTKIVNNAYIWTANGRYNYDVYHRSNLFSVRCLKDQDAPKTDILTDSRDGKVYKTVVIGSQTWMAENLNYKTDDNNSRCYGEGGEVVSHEDYDLQYTLEKSQWEANCSKYGRLYNWGTAAVKSTCPSGWHLPAKSEWDILTNYIGGWLKGGKLLAAGEWIDNLGRPDNLTRPGTGTDEYGFSALPGGTRSRSDGKFYDIGYQGNWWTSDEDGLYASYIYIDYNTHNWHSNIAEVSAASGGNKEALYSVRCVKD